MNAIKSLFQNVVSVKAHAFETIQTKDSTSSSPSDTKIEDVQNTTKSTLQQTEDDAECKVLQETVFGKHEQVVWQCMAFKENKTEH